MAGEYFKVKDATKKRMIQLFRWLPNTKSEKRWLEEERKRISKTKGRSAMLVKSNRGVTLYVNKVADLL